MPGSRPGRTKEDLVKDFRTAEILDAARQVISDQGIAEASMERIAQAAGIAKGTIYLYFKNKEELLLQAVSHGFDELMNRTRGATQRVVGTRPKLEELVLAALTHTAEQQNFFEALAERGSLGPDGASKLTEQIFELDEAYVSFVAEIVAEGQAKSELRAFPPELAARLLTNCVRGAVVARYRRGRTGGPGQDDATDDPRREAGLLVDFFLRGVGTAITEKGNP